MNCSSGIQTVAGGQPYLSPAIASYPANRQAGSNRAGDPFSLAPAELSVIKLIAKCRTTKEIAALLFISPRTVETRRANICQKPGLRGNHALAKFALAHQAES